MSAKIKKGDRVMVLAGKDKGRQGAVLKVFPKEERVLVEGLNIVHRHTKPSQGDPQGGIKHKEEPPHVARYAPPSPNTNPTPCRRRENSDKKVRFAKTTGEVING